MRAGIRGYAVGRGIVGYALRVRFDQVKMIVRDANRLATFYQDALGCQLLSPIQEFSDDNLSRGVGAPGAGIRLALFVLMRDPEGNLVDLWAKEEAV